MNHSNRNQITLGILGKWSIRFDRKAKWFGIWIFLTLVAVCGTLIGLFTQSRDPKVATSGSQKEVSGYYAIRSDADSDPDSDSDSDSDSDYQDAPAISITAVAPDQTDVSVSDSRDIEYIPIGIEKSKSHKTLQKTLDIFSARTDSLRQALGSSGYYFTEKRLDESIRTSALILAKDERYAANLNGYFYYLLDQSLSSEVISPVILNIAMLFDEEHRDKVTSDGTYAQEDLRIALQKSLKALLASDYKDEIFDFIMEGYRESFRSRIQGRSAKASIFRLRSGSLEIRFHDSFMTYIEFYMLADGD
jgi:hypothetical protein